MLSWSLLEAMSVGCTILASHTPPLLEAIQPEVTGRLIDFFDVDGLVAQADALLSGTHTASRLGRAARAHAVAHYDLKTICLPGQLQWVQALADGPASQAV